MIKKMLHINGMPKTVIAEPDTLLADVLREQLKLTGTKVGCGQGQCGCCSVILDGKLVRSCVTKMKRVEDGAQVTTIEGIGTPDNLHPLQLAWIVHGGAQCGFCTPGFIVSAKALLDENKRPTRAQVRDWFQKHRNACRCTGYKPLVDAVMDAAKVLRGEMTRKTWSSSCRPTAASGAPTTPGPPPWPRSPARAISAPTWVSKCRPTRCTWPWSRPRSRTPTSCPSTPPQPRRCPAWSRSSPTRTSRARTASPA